MEDLDFGVSQNTTKSHQKGHGGGPALGRKSGARLPQPPAGAQLLQSVATQGAKC